MKKTLALIVALLFVLSAVACGGKSNAKQESAGVEKLVEEYGFQWKDPNAPILNEKGAKELSFSVYSSKNASALDYNDMKIMQDLFESTNVFVSWENVSESVYAQQKNLIFGNADKRPDAIYHAGMGAGEMKDMRFACRVFLNKCETLNLLKMRKYGFGTPYDHDSQDPKNQIIEKQEIEFYNALEELRNTFGIILAEISKAYEIDIEDDLASILPPKDE